jgi:ribonucleoside-diphosphate reductase
MKMKAELNASIDLAIIYEPFKGWNKDNEFININNKIIGANKFYQFIDDEYPEETKRMIKFGRRNVSWSTAAPTGSQSILTQTTSGIEPLFLPFYKRRVKCIDENQRVDFIDTDGQKFTEYVVLHYQFKQWIKINHPEIAINNLNPDETQKLYEQSPWFGSCAGDIDFAARILIQKIVQKYTSHSISSTLNLPNNATKEQVANIYYNSWKLGLKGQTVYRDGCRKGVIVSTDKIEQTEDDFKDVRAPKRSIELPADYYTVYDKKKCYSILIGLMNNRPYEIFIISDITGLPEILDDNKIKGVIRKEMKDVYLFEADSYDFIIPNLQDAEHDEKELGLMLSTMLRHGVPLKFLIKTLNKTKPIAGSFTYKLIKILSKYIPNGEETGEKCPDCGAKIRYENGCRKCYNCGYSAC